jgi:hypothetical protein
MKTTDLYANRGWDRTDLDIETLARLALSIKTSGWQEAHPVVYETLPNGRREIRWGHRRTLAAAIAAMSDGLETVEDIVEFITRLATEKMAGDVCPACGSAVTADNETCPACHVDLYAQSEDSEAVFLGVEGDVDVVNSHHLVEAYDTFIHQVEVEVPAQELSYVDEATSQLALIQDGIGREDADVLGLSKAIYRAVTLGASREKIAELGLTDNEVQSYLAIAQMPEFGEMIANDELAMSIPRLVFQLEDKNQREAVLNLIYPRIRVGTVEGYIKSIKSYTVPQPDMLASPAVNNHTKITAFMFDKWMAEDPVKLWMAIASGNAQVPENIYELMPELSCSNCPLNGKLRKLPKIHTSMGGGYGCQREKDPQGCIYNATAVYADYRVKSAADLEFSDAMYFSTVELAAAAYNAIAVNDEKPEAVEDTRPIDQQRAVIATFMLEQAKANGREHPFATSCDTCGYHLDASPVKSAPDAPHCAWAGKRATVKMELLKDEKDYTIPRCLQYTPLLQFGEMVPPTDPGTVPEPALERLIDQLAGQLEYANVPPLRRLTGVPLSATERHLGWFRERLAESNLSIKQKATLVLWLSFELDLNERRKAVLQLPVGRVGYFSEA